MRFDEKSNLPLFQQIADQIADGILTDIFEEETQIPSTTEISSMYRINPATVLKGMNLLVDSEILYKKRGVGMFVKQGAKAQIIRTRKIAFKTTYLQPLLQEAKKINISDTEIIEMLIAYIKGDDADD
jgi:Predicted transcriptional regulators